MEIQRNSETSHELDLIFYVRLHARYPRERRNVILGEMATKSIREPCARSWLIVCRKALLYIVQSHAAHCVNAHLAVFDQDCLIDALVDHKLFPSELIVNLKFDQLLHQQCSIRPAYSQNPKRCIKLIVRLVLTRVNL